jgi:hypothetical protein
VRWSKRDTPYFQAAFRVRLANNLQDIGFGVERKRDDFEIAGISADVLKRFSRRTEQIEKLAETLGITDPDRKAELGAESRENKGKALSWETLRREWNSRLSDSESGALAAVHRRELKQTRSVNGEAKAVDHAIEHSFVREAVLPERKLLTEALKRGLDAVTVEDVTHEMKSRPLIRSEFDGREIATTKEMVALESKLIDFASKGRGRCRPLGDPARSCTRDWFNEGQKAAVSHVLGSRDRVMIIRGVAGTGKTTLEQEIGEALAEAGKPVIALAQSVKASREVLREEAGFANADTVARFLKDEKMQESVKGGIILVDEASQLGTRDMLKLFEVAERTQARMLLVGGHILGYKSDPADKGKLVIDEEGASIVRRVFDLFEELGSAGAVTRKLNDLGIRNPTFTTRSEKVRGGKLFTKQKIIGILRNRIYLGEIHWGEAEQTNCHDPIINQDQFDRVQHHLGQTIKRRQNRKKSRGRRYLLTGLLRCQCGAHMVGAAAHGRHDVYRYYICTRQNHEGGKHSCQAPRLPADALEHALLERLRELGTLVEARDRVVRRALECLDTESDKLKEEEEVIRRQIARVKADTGRLVEVLKTMGTRGIASVQDELDRLECEEKALRANLIDIQQRQEPVLRVGDEAKKFVETWTNVGDLLEQVTPDERFLILQHYVEVLELRATDPKGKAGTYVLRLFPEVRPHRDPGDPDGGAPAVLPQPPKPPEMPNGAATAPGNGPDLLTEDGLVRITVQKTPRVGLEPTSADIGVAFGSPRRRV